MKSNFRRSWSMLFFLLLTAGHECAAAAASLPVPRMRLPDQATPVRYTLELKLVPGNDGYSGTIDIDLHVKFSTRVLWINSNGLEIESASLAASGEIFPATARVGSADFIALEFSRDVPAGLAALKLRFEGKYALKETRGLFKQLEKGDWYAFTQFEPLHARRAFPCFDEPQWKTPWRVTLKVKNDQMAVANTPIDSEQDIGDGFKRVEFAETKPLPTYLVAFATGPFAVLDGGKAGKNGTVLRYIVPKGRTEDARYAREVTPRILESLEHYFGSAYPFEKLDSLVIPTTVNFGAMENAGLVTYSGNILLARHADETIRFKQRYASIAAHELAHQWFGNLVTMAWWDDIWLNESFATWMSNKIVDRLYPEWQWQVRRVAERTSAMDVDVLASARKIRQPVENRNDLANAFDRITYQKGASVLAMFEAWLGERRFRDGVYRYLKQHEWGNATGRDFIGALAEDDLQVGPAFESFVEQVGIPRVSVALVCDGAPHLRLAQRPFLPLGSQTGSASRWLVPVCVRYPAGTQESRACTLLAGDTVQLPLVDALRCPDWIEPDHLAVGYYRSQLEGDLPGKLSSVASKLALPEQVGLLDNAAALARSGDQSMADALTLAVGLAAHRRHEVVEGSADIVSMLGDDIVPPALRPGRARLIDKYYGSRARGLGPMPRPADDDNVHILRAMLVNFTAQRGDDAVLLGTMRDNAWSWLGNRRAVDGLMVEPMLKAAAIAGDHALFIKMLAEAKSTQDRRERGFLLAALGHFRDPQIARLALQVTLGQDIEGRDSISILQAALANDATRQLAFDFMVKNYDALEARLPREFTARFPLWASGTCTTAGRDDMAAFFRSRMAKVEGGPRNLAQALERVDLCLAFKAAQQASVVAFLENY